MYHHFGDIYFQSTTIQIILYCFSVDWNGQFFLFFILLFTFSLRTTHFLMNIGKELCPVRLLLVPSLKNSFIPFPCFRHWFFSQYSQEFFIKVDCKMVDFFALPILPFISFLVESQKILKGKKVLPLSFHESALLM